MEDLNIGIFHDDELAGELGKKGTVSDIRMFNRKEGERVYTFMAPVDDKVSAKSQIMCQIDCAVVCISEVKPAVGETIVMLDSFGIRKGVIVAPEYMKGQIGQMVRGTAAENYRVMEKNAQEIIAHLEGLKVQRKAEGSVKVVIDHSFTVRGVGEVVLGLVEKGTVKKHDKLTLYPSGKEVIVRSIQMQDKDFEEAPAGSRVGLAVKGATSEEMGRGTVLASQGSLRVTDSVGLEFRKNRFFGELKPGVFHMTVGMQTLPVRVTEVSEGKVRIESDKKFVFESSDKFMILDLNAKKLHVVGSGKA